ncbi:universal stress protein [uncultured Croceitalea sp.]|uniref:universal stress protein n=1 Tax=uncultured Croceitalea sp. TaxID=1798908 RepID=UPI00374E21F0
MRNILLPTDFSENAWNAISYAIKLFKEEECVFHLLNTYTPAIASNRFMASSINENILNGESYSKNGLKRTIERITNKFGINSHRFKTHSSFSLLVDQIKELVQNEDIDIVVTGTKGASGLKEVFMGNNTVRILKGIRDCPVLVIPQYFDFTNLKEIAFATDFNRFYTKSELRPLKDLAIIFNATVRIVHVQHEIKTLSELQQFNLDMLRKYLDEVEHFVHTVSELNSISQTLRVFTNELDIHLLAMLNYQHSYMEKITREPVVKSLTFHTQIPLLIIPELGMSKTMKSNDKVSVSSV